MREMIERARGSVRLRITVAATLVFAVAFGFMAWFIVRTVRDRLEDQVRSDVEAGIETIRTQLEAGTAPDQLTLQSAGVASAQVVINGNVFVVKGSATDVVSPYQTSGVGAGGIPNVSGDSLLVSSRAIVNDKPVSIFAASPLADVRRSIDALAAVLVGVTPVLVLAVGGLVWLLVGRALRPVGAITAEVEEISHTTMHRRVPEPGSRDEVWRLARTMNDMLGRLETAQQRQRAFVSDASHELRTPITTVQTALEVGLRRGELDEAARNALAANNRLQSVVADLLDLARLDEPSTPFDELPEVDLEDVVLEQVAAVGDDRVQTTAVLPARVHGTRDQLGRVVRNLLDNAVRHTKTQVVLALQISGPEVVLTVGDDGPGIPVDDRERVFDRFVRLDGDRGRARGGAGLGLAIVKRIVEQHGGHVRATGRASGLPGAQFEVRLPSPPSVL
jgi:signal transduction histidine kinase